MVGKPVVIRGYKRLALCIYTLQLSTCLPGATQRRESTWANHLNVENSVDKLWTTFRCFPQINGLFGWFRAYRYWVAAMIPPRIKPNPVNSNGLLPKSLSK